MARAQLPCEVQRGNAAEHQIHDRDVEAGRSVEIDAAQRARNDHVGCAVVAAQLLDIHRYEKLVFQNEDTQTIEQGGQANHSFKAGRFLYSNYFSVI